MSIQQNVWNNGWPFDGTEVDDVETEPTELEQEVIELQKLAEELSKQNVELTNRLEQLHDINAQLESNYHEVVNDIVDRREQITELERQLSEEKSNRERINGVLIEEQQRSEQYYASWRDAQSSRLRDIDEIKKAFGKSVAEFPEGCRDGKWEYIQFAENYHNLLRDLREHMPKRQMTVEMVVDVDWDPQYRSNDVIGAIEQLEYCDGGITGVTIVSNDWIEE